MTWKIHKKSLPVTSESGDRGSQRVLGHLLGTVADCPAWVWRAGCMCGATEPSASGSQLTAEARGRCRLSFQNEQDPGCMAPGTRPVWAPCPHVQLTGRGLSLLVPGQARQPGACPGRVLGPL